MLKVTDNRLIITRSGAGHWVETGLKALTALSDEEVIYKEEHNKLYYLSVLLVR